MCKKKHNLPSKNLTMILLSVGLIYVLYKYRKLGYLNTFWIRFTLMAYSVTVISWIILTFFSNDDDGDDFM